MRAREVGISSLLIIGAFVLGYYSKRNDPPPPPPPPPPPTESAPKPVVIDTAKQIINNYKIANSTASNPSRTYGFAVPKEVINDLKDYNVVDGKNISGFQIYYGLTSDTILKSFICIPLDDAGNEFKRADMSSDWQSKFISRLPIEKALDIYTRPCPFACDQRSEICVDCWTEKPGGK